MTSIKAFEDGAGRLYTICFDGSDAVFAATGWEEQPDGALAWALTRAQGGEPAVDWINIDDPDAAAALAREAAELWAALSDGDARIIAETGDEPVIWIDRLGTASRCPPGRRAYCSDECARAGRLAGQRDWQRAYYARQHPALTKSASPACIVCGKPLTGRQEKYCSDECNIAAKISRRAAARAAVSMCIVCGAPLPAGNQKYCGDCKKKYKSYYSLTLAAMTPEEQTAFRAQMVQRRTEKIAAMSPEELEEYRRAEVAYTLARRAKMLAAMTPEEREEYRISLNAYQKERYRRKTGRLSDDLDSPPKKTGGD